MLKTQLFLLLPLHFMMLTGMIHQIQFILMLLYLKHVFLQCHK